MRFVLFVDWDTGIHTVNFTTDIKADINKTYRCVSDIRVYRNNVTIVLQDATIQAYLSGSNFSKEGKVLSDEAAGDTPQWMGSTSIWQSLYV